MTIDKAKTQWPDTGGIAECRTCGFLTLRRKDTLELVVADRWFRERGFVEPVYAPQFEQKMYCAVRKSNLEEEKDGIRLAEGGPAAQPSKRLDVIKLPRPECESGELQRWVRWEPMFTPKEHREILFREILLKREDRRDWRQIYANLLITAAAAFGAVILGVWLTR